MSLLNSLFSGVSGLRNHQTMMDVIGDNIANVNTLGYKASRISFSDTLSQFVRYGTNPTETSGGTNTFQVGLGMKVNSIDRNWNQGTFERTGISTDLALQGTGMFILEKNGQKFYSRAGNFIFDGNGTLVNSQTGARVLGKKASIDGVVPPGTNLEDITIDPAMRLPAKATTEIGWNGNLSSSSTLTRSETFVETGVLNSAMGVGENVVDTNSIYNENGTEFKLKVTYTKTAANTYDMSWQLQDVAGTTVSQSTAPTSMVYNATTGALQTMNGAAPTTIAVADATNLINLKIDPRNIKESNQTSTVASTVDGGRTPNIVNGTLTIFDSLGNSHTLTVKFTKTSDNHWNWNASLPATSGSLSQNSGTINFNSDGSIESITPSPSIMGFTPVNGAANQSINLDFGKNFAGITQTSSGSAVSPSTQNGTAAASLLNLNVDQYGKVVGVFSNGESRDLAQVMIANFNNMNGLINAGDNMFTVGANSGAPVFGEPGEATRTTVNSGALEQSNVDLSDEFTKMIVSQRGFQANARVVTTADNLLQEITNLVR